MEHKINSYKDQDILEKIRRLEPNQITEVIDFIEFLSERKKKQFSIKRLLNEKADPQLKLEDVRKRLSKIPGNMSGTVRELRDERG